MLARSAQGLYWMSRYLERAKHLCRLLRLQSECPWLTGPLVRWIFWSYCARVEWTETWTSFVRHYGC